MKLTTALKVFVAIGIAELAGIIGSFFTMNAIPTWYVGIVKPEWNPPSWVFGPVWTTLYAMMGIASFLVWRKMDSGRRGNGGLDSRFRGNDRFDGKDPVKFASLTTGQAKIPKQMVRGALTIFGVQLVLNSIWSIIFFGFKNPGLAFIEIILLWIAIVATIWMFAKISKPAAWLLVPYILWVSFAGFLNYTIWDLNKEGALKEIYCTADAMVCPDGSAVGRSGPNCEFAQCPEVLIDPLWKRTTDEKTGISFSYPEELSTTYMRAYDWPPKVQVFDGPFTCTATGSEITRAGKTELRMVNNRSYCVTTVSEGAAGSTYTQYAYITERVNALLVFTATVRATQCGNYDEPQKTECEGERETFDFDSVMDRIIQTTVTQ